MTKKDAAKRSSGETRLRVYYDYDVAGGGPPFGHVWTFRVELKLKGKTIVRNASAGDELRRIVEKQGKAVGEKKDLPRDRGYSSRSYEQQFTLPVGLTAKQIETRIPFESVL